MNRRSTAVLKRCVGALALLILLAPFAGARSEDGTLKITAYPISTRPVIVRPGDTFDMELRSVIDINSVRVWFSNEDVEEFQVFVSDKMDVFEVRDRSTFDLPSWDCVVEGWKMSWMWRPRTVVRDEVIVPVTLPEDVPEGFYDMRVVSSAGQDFSRRAVQVISEFPEEYTIVKITDTHFGCSHRNGEEHMRIAAREINELRPSFVMVTGDLTQDNFPHDHESFVKDLDIFEVPTFVVGGNHDLGGKVYEGHADMLLYYGTPYYSFAFGDHHYQGIDNASRFFDEEHVQWMHEDLAAAQDRAMRIIFGHGMYLQSQEDTHWFNNELWDQYDVHLYLYGHWHRDIIETKRDGQTTWVCTAAIADLPRYAVVEIADNEVVSVEHRTAE